MAFIVYDAKEIGFERSLTIDKYGRIYMSAGLARDLGAQGLPFKAHIAYDPDTDSIGIARPGTVSGVDSVDPVTFDGKRRYASLRKFLRKHHIAVENDGPPKTYVFITKRNGWYEFRPIEKEFPPNIVAMFRLRNHASAVDIYLNIRKSNERTFLRPSRALLKKLASTHVKVSMSNDNIYVKSASENEEGAILITKDGLIAITKLANENDIKRGYYSLEGEINGRYVFRHMAKELFSA
jgi:hypothetical protein